ncbi:MAG TPA: imidazolonepropionase [Acidimicrobiales bacterium]|nr:imidazolonepropionase [Acidimicrobiales bacterium]
MPDALGDGPVTRWDLLVTNGSVATMDPGRPGAYGLVANGAVAVGDGRIDWVGPAADLPAGATAAHTIDAGGALVTPGLVDCHTHLVFAGDRVAEFEARLAGADYEELARRGGGIAATVRATRAATTDELVAGAVHRARQLLADGVTTVEIKSGYGLDLDTERRMLRAARRVGDELPLRVRTTFLGAHTVPAAHAADPDGYVDVVCEEMVPAVAAEGLADAVDAFCERIAFSPAQVARVFDAARRHGLPVKLHADQLSDGGSAGLAASFSALSADHLEHTSEAGVRALAAAGTVAVLLPGATYTLGEPARAPVAALRPAGVPLAVSTDANPGTSPLLSLRLAANLACTLLGLTPPEALCGITRTAARALGLQGTAGVLKPGTAADLVVWDAGHPAELVYWIGGRLARTVIVGGEPLPNVRWLEGS